MFPPRNLPNNAVPWARDVETRVERAESENDRNKQSTDNSARSFSGQLSVLSNQLTELSFRNIESFPIPTFTVTGGIGQFVGSTTVNITGTGDGRAAIITVGLSMDESPVSGGGSPYVELNLNGAVVARAMSSFVSLPPAGWPMAQSNLAGYARLAPGNNVLTISMYKTANFGSSSTWTATGFGSVFYGDRID